MCFQNLIPKTSVISMVMVVLFCKGYAASIYYVANDSSGDDTRSSLQVSNFQTPWKTFKNFSNRTLAPGDEIRLRRGCVWYETLVINGSGDQNRFIKIQTYGSSPNPAEINGFDTISGAEIGGGVYKSLKPVLSEVSAVSINTKRIPIARFPVDSEWILTKRIIDKSRIEIDGLDGRDFYGASIHVRTGIWILETRKVASGGPGYVVLDKPLLYQRDGIFAFLSNDSLSFRKTANSWFQSPVSNYVYWKKTAEAGSKVLFPKREYGIHTGANSYISISGIKVTGTTLAGVYSTGKYISILNCNLVNPGKNGVVATGYHSEISQDTIVGALENGVWCAASNCKVYKNVVSRIATKNTFGRFALGDGRGGNGVLVSGDSALIRMNTIDSIGYNGISFRGINSIVDSNVISRACATNEDCGGIYTHAGKHSAPGSAGSLIRRNIVADALGAPSGWPKLMRTFQGIALDDASHDILIDSNVIYGNSKGVTLHNTRRITIKANYIFNNKLSQISYDRDTLAGKFEDMIDNVSQGNVLVYNGNSTFYEETFYEASQSTPLGTFKSNIKCQDFASIVRCYKDDSVIWESDKMKLLNYVMGKETQLNGSGDSNVVSWTAWPDQQAIQIDSGKNCFDRKCFRAHYRNISTPPRPLLVSGQRFAINQGTQWNLSFRAKSHFPKQKLIPTLRNAIKENYIQLAEVPSFQIDSTWRKYTAIVTTTSASSDARLDLESALDDSIYWIDSISLRSVSLDPASVPPLSKYIVSGTDMILSSSLPKTSKMSWKDPFGKFVYTIPQSRFSAFIAFPVSELPIIIPNKVVATSDVTVVNTRHGIQITGLRESAMLFNSKGSFIGNIHPTSEGGASLSLSSPCAPCFIRLSESKQAIKLISIQ